MSKNTSPATGSASKKAKASEAEILQLEYLSFIASVLAKAATKGMTQYNADAVYGHYTGLNDRLRALKGQNS